MGPARGLRDESTPALLGRTVLIRRIEVEAHTLPDKSWLLFDQRSRTSIPVSESAGRIWQLCDGDHTLDEIVDHLVSVYDAERLQIDHDAREFLALLERRGLVQSTSSSSEL
jgi:hypothetical protein